MQDNRRIGNKRYTRSGAFFLCSLWVITLLLTTGCAQVNWLREAQDAFNQAASAENTLRFDNPQTLDSSIASLSGVRNGYTSVLLSLDRIDVRDAEKLKSDQLWGNVLTLKALSQWRLGLYDQAMATVAQAKREGSVQKHPRDSALMEALPGLIKNDQAYRKILDGRPLEEVEDLLVGNLGASKDLREARALVGEEHPVQIYLIQSQLAVYRNLVVGYYRLKNKITVPPEHPARKDAKKHLEDLSRTMGRVKPDAKRAVVDYWAFLLGFDAPL